MQIIPYATPWRYHLKEAHGVREQTPDFTKISKLAAGEPIDDDKNHRTIKSVSCASLVNDSLSEKNMRKKPIKNVIFISIPVSFPKKKTTVPNNKKNRHNRRTSDLDVQIPVLGQI